MLLRYMFAMGVLIVAQASQAKVFPNWTVGQEREIDQGVYARLVSQKQGWRVWRFETVNGVTCRAVKSAAGRPHPYPLGVRTRLYGGTPFVEIDAYQPVSVSTTLSGEWGGGKGEYRSIGDRFWKPFSADTDLAAKDGEKLEVHIQTWEYDEILVGLADETGVLDLTGALAARNAVLDCVSRA